MKDVEFTYQRLGKNALVITCKTDFTEEVLSYILTFKEIIKKAFNNYQLEIIPVYNSITILFNHTQVTDNIINKLQELQRNINHKKADLRYNLWELPVCYDNKFGIDLNAIMAATKLSKKEIINLHTQTTYTVYGIGFLPGFLYLGEVHKSLQIQRKSKPRLKITKGAVGIAGKQTGIYPQESPGGWNIIGNCPVPLFNPSKKPPVFAKVGDQIKFKAISIHEYELLQIKVAANIFSISPVQE